MAELNSQHSQFVYLFADWFVPEIIENKYKPLLDKINSNYRSVLDLLNAHIIGCTYPGMSFDQAEQQRERIVIKYKSVLNINNIFEGQFTVTFESIYGNLNHMLMQDIMMQNYLDVDSQSRTHWPGFIWHILGEQGDVLYTVRYDRVYPVSLDGMEYSYADSELEEQKTFSATFGFNFINVKYSLDPNDEANFFGGNVINDAGR